MVRLMEIQNSSGHIKALRYKPLHVKGKENQIR